MKFMKHLFTVPEGEKVTDRHMKRILASSICGILLCMSCLFSTTWAWYTVSVASKPISLDVADVYLTVSVNDVQTMNEQTDIALPAGESAQVRVVFGPEAKPDSFDNQPKRYIVITVYDEEASLVSTYYTIPDESGAATLNVATDEACTIYFAPAWQMPLEGKQYPATDFKLIEVSEEAAESTSAATTEAVASTPVTDSGSTGQQTEQSDESNTGESATSEDAATP